MQVAGRLALWPTGGGGGGGGSGFVARGVLNLI
jgi:hypothetical protein